MAKKKEKDIKKSEEVIDKAIEEKVEVISENVSKPMIDVQSIKNDLTDYMRMRIDKEVSEAVERANKKIIHHKNSIIIKRDILIVVLLVICFFLGYNLYNVSNINIDITRAKKNESTKIKKTSVKEESKDSEEVKEKSLEEKKSEYGSLIDDIIIDEESDYIDNFYDGDLTDEIKLYLALNRLDDVTNEDDTIYIDDDKLKESYEELFDSEFSPKSFKYGSFSFRHLTAKSMFIADGEFKKVKSNIKKEITEINEEDDKVIINTVEGIVKDNKLYDIKGREIKKYNGGKMDEFESSLNKIKYEFIKIDDKYKLSKIEKGN
ncbi:MAG: hypothetical protein IKJ43_03710 [Bacilli bacterium]|nr:hypothetical protein [Bacilli bacterium]